MDEEIRVEGHSHEPVLLVEIIDFLRCREGGTFVDCTLGLGGHSEAILRSAPDTRVIGIDRDEEALAVAVRRLAVFEERFQALHANFADIEEVLAKLGVTAVRGIVADLGVSSLQLEREDRGFSFAADAPLDMRMDRGEGQTAAGLLGALTETELADVIFEYGEERGARRIARAIVNARARAPITTTRQLADLVVRALHVPGRWRIHPATRTFQALRIAVNQELRAVETLIPAALSALASGGRLAIISFHSLEDRIVKHAFLKQTGRCTCPAALRIGVESRDERSGPGGPQVAPCPICGAARRVHLLTRKPVRPSSEEVERNPRSRSALLRVCEKL